MKRVVAAVEEAVLIAVLERDADYRPYPYLAWDGRGEPDTPRGDRR